MSFCFPFCSSLGHTPFSSAKSTHPGCLCEPSPGHVSCCLHMYLPLFISHPLVHVMFVSCCLHMYLPLFISHPLVHVMFVSCCLHMCLPLFISHPLVHVMFVSCCLHMYLPLFISHPLVHVMFVSCCLDMYLPLLHLSPSSACHVCFMLSSHVSSPSSSLTL